MGANAPNTSAADLMRISTSEPSTVIVVSAVPPTNSGGMQISTAYLCRSLRAIGCEVTLLAPSCDPDEENLLPHSVRHIDLPRHRFFHPTFIRSIKTVFRSIAATAKPVALISESAAGFALLSQCRALGIPFVFHAHGTAGRELKVACSMRSPQRVLYRLALLGLDRLLLSQVQAIAAVSPQIAEELNGSSTLQGPIIRYIPNGVPTDVFSPDWGERTNLRREWGILPADKIIVFAGRLSPQKGVDLLLEAAARLTHTPHGGRVLVWILGAGEARTHLARLADALRLTDRVTFHGRISPLAVRRFVNGADVFALPSRRPEGMPYAVLEAQLLGVPVVVSDALDKDSEDVIFHRKNDSADLARALHEAMSTAVPDIDLARRTAVSHSLESQSHALKRLLGEIGAIRDRS